MQVLDGGAFGVAWLLALEPITAAEEKRPSDWLSLGHLPALGWV